VDPFQGLASFVLGQLKQSAVSLWLKLLFTMFFSSSVTLAFFTGTVAFKTGSLATGFASGLIAAALVLVALFKLSPLTKGLTIALPTQILEEEAKQNIQTVERK
jgi:hypothetical protein